MYDLVDYSQMLTDGVRAGAYREALRRAVTPGCRVAEIGAGAGHFSVLAARLGAGRVWAIEPDDVIRFAEGAAAAGGLRDRVTVLQAPSNRVELPERVDVLLSDMRGVLPLHPQNLPSLIDARDRWLAPGGVMIARADSLMAAVVEAPREWGEVNDAWSNPAWGPGWEEGRETALSTPFRVRLAPESLLSTAAEWGRIDYATVRSPHLSGTVRLEIPRRGTGHGVLTWFDADLAEGLGFSTGPAGPRSVYGTLFFPWPSPLRLDEGEVVEIRMEARLVRGRYVWRWETRVGDGEPRLQIRQNNAFAGMLSPDRLRAEASHAVRIPDAALLRTLLAGDGDTPRDMAARLCAEHPARFPDLASALPVVRESLARLGAEPADPEPHEKP